MFTMLLSPEFETEKVISPDFKQEDVFSAYERFLADGGINSPDCYLVRENEDFSFDTIAEVVPEVFENKRLVA